MCVYDTLNSKQHTVFPHYTSQKSTFSFGKLVSYRLGAEESKKRELGKKNWILVIGEEGRRKNPNLNFSIQIAQNII